MSYTFYENRKQGNINKNFALEAWDLEESLFLSRIGILNYFSFKSMAFWWKREDIGIWKAFLGREVSVEEKFNSTFLWTQVFKVSLKLIQCPFFQCYKLLLWKFK